MEFEPRILVVEDDRIVASVFNDLLARHSFDADVVGDAEQGLELLAQKPYDLVLSDIVLPGLSGVDLARRAKEIAPDVDVILMTAYANMETAVQAIRAGVYDYLIKPFDDINDVLLKIERALEKRRILIENRRLIGYLRQANQQIEGMNRDLERQVTERTAELEDANQRLAQLTVTDDVTGLYNQRFLHGRLEEEYLRATRYGEGLSVIMIDIDYFKRVNDTHDHMFGSRVLKRLGKMVRAKLRNTDMLIRYGGDEFVALLPHTRLREAIAVAERLRGAVEQTELGEAEDAYRVTISLGVAAVGECTASSGETLLIAADKALYFAKARGRNRVAVMHGKRAVTGVG